MTTPATIYARFSSLEQIKGNTLKRQFELCERIARQHQWELAEDRRLSDQGRSAFSGANRKPGGAFHDFEQKAAAGHFMNGHVLIVERIDRISRQGWEEVLPLLTKLTSQGVTIAVADGGRIYPAFQRVTMAMAIEATLMSELAYEESKNKSRHGNIKWAERLEGIKEGSRIAAVRTVPGWIDVHPETKVMSLNPDRAAVVREIFDLTIAGYGTPAIAKRLNERNEPVWNYRGRESNNGWTVGYLTKLVLNRAVLGE